MMPPMLPIQETQQALSGYAALSAERAFPPDFRRGSASNIVHSNGSVRLCMGLFLLVCLGNGWGVIHQGENFLFGGILRE